MDGRALEEAGDRLRHRRHRALEAGLLTAATGALAGLAALVSVPLAGALAVGAALEGAIALAAVAGRREQIARLALDPAAYVLPEVNRYGTRVARPSGRARLAAWLAEIAAGASPPGSLHLRDRAALVAQELDALARELASPALSVQPATVVACRRLLTRPVDSPLYNPRLPADELRLALRRIRAGIS